MMEKPFRCSACGEFGSITGPWFLIFADYWNDRLNILRWNDSIASNSGLQHACCPAHVQILVQRWIKGESSYFRSPSPADHAALETLALSHCFPVGQITIYRDSLAQTIRDNPDSMRTLLAAVLATLEQDLPQPIIACTVDDSGNGAWAI
jgi:hypothetical protein